MRTTSYLVHALAATALLGATAACSSDLATRPTTSGGAAAATAPVAFSLAAAPTSAGIAATMTGMLAGNFGDPSGYGWFGDGDGHHWHGWPGRVRPSDVDSLIVTVSKVEVLTALSDSETAADSAADSVSADSGHGDDDHDDFEEREFGWTSLAIVGSGTLDLAHLPDSASAGLTVASGALPPGRYRHVRLFVTNPQIFFDSTIVTPAGDTLQAGVGYPVVFPSADSTGAAIKTDQSFTVPTGGGNVPLYFDRDDTVRHIIITGDGKIVVPPVIR